MTTAIDINRDINLDDICYVYEGQPYVNTLVTLMSTLM